MERLVVRGETSADVDASAAPLEALGWSRAHEGYIETPSAVLVMVEKDG